MTSGSEICENQMLDLNKFKHPLLLNMLKQFLGFDAWKIICIISNNFCRM